MLLLQSKISDAVHGLNLSGVYTGSWEKLDHDVLTSQQLYHCSAGMGLLEWHAGHSVQLSLIFGSVSFYWLTSLYSWGFLLFNRVMPSPFQ